MNILGPFDRTPGISSHLAGHEWVYTACLGGRYGWPPSPIGKAMVQGPGVFKFCSSPRTGWKKPLGEPRWVSAWVGNPETTPTPRTYWLSEVNHLEECGLGYDHTLAAPSLALLIWFRILTWAGWRLAMSFCRSQIPLSTLVEPANGTVQCLLAPGPCQLWLVSSIPPFLLREWEDSIQTESAGFSLVFIGKANWHETLRQTSSGCLGRCLSLLFFCLFSNKSMLNWVVIGAEQQVQKNNSAANSNEKVGLIPSGRYSEDNRSPCQQLN